MTREAPVILLTGKNGQVGWELQRALMGLGKVAAVDIAAMDLTDPDAIIKMLRQVKPDVVINAAAYTAVDQAEQDADRAMRINGLAPGILAEESKRLGAFLIHYSTDYVFDGAKRGAYDETDTPNPINVYGKTKLKGEQAVRSAGGDHLVLRTSWVYAGRGRNFLLTMLRLMREKEVLRVVDDQEGAPTWARLIAETTVHLLGQSLTERKKGIFQSGLYHLTAAGSTSWCGFAEKIWEFVRKTMAEELQIQKIEAVSTETYPTPAKRPMNSRLALEKLEQRYRLVMPAWDEALALCMEDIR
ncbi:MAG: dTDP-4-dehydrorhamnose reductase [Nitrospiria bacterium]